MHAGSARMAAAAGAVWVCSLAGAAAGQQGVNEDFDCYLAGAAASTLPGWELWQQPPGLEGFISDERAFSGGNSLHLNQALADVVRRVEFREGRVTFSVMTYVPSESLGLEAYVITLTQYDGGGVLTDWALQILFDSDLGHLEAQFRGDRTPLIFDRWVELRAEADLTADLVDLYYDGQLWARDMEWVANPHGLPWFVAIDFYIHELASGPGMYIDDVVATEAGVATPPTCGTTCYADCDGSGARDIFDFLCFQNLFAAGDVRADCDQDGDLTFFDFLCFQDEFAKRCF